MVHYSVLRRPAGCQLNEVNPHAQGHSRAQHLRFLRRSELNESVWFEMNVHGGRGESTRVLEATGKDVSHSFTPGQVF